MPAGVETYDPQARLLISWTGRINRQLGEIRTGGANGSRNVPELAQGIPWIATAPNQSYGTTGVVGCVVSLSGTTITWSYPTGRPGDPVPTTILYGCADGRRHAGGNLLGELLIDSSNIKMFLRHYGTAGASFTVPAIDPVVFVRPLESGAGGGLRSAANGVADIGISGPASTTFSTGRCRPAAWTPGTSKASRSSPPASIR